MQYQLFVPRRPAFCRLAAAAILGVAALCLVVPLQAQQTDLHFFMTFVDASGEPLTDVVPEELQITENGRPGTILQLESVGRPLDVTLLLDNGFGMEGALGELRNGARAFFAEFPEGTQMSLLTIAPQPRWLQRPTTNQRDIQRAVDRMAPDQSLGRFLDALVEFGGRMGKQSEERHAVVVAIGSNGPDGSTALEQHFLQLARRVVDQSATVHAAIVSTNARVTGARIPEGVSSDLQQVVGLELSRLTGGRYEQLAVSSRLVSLLPEMAAQIRADGERYRIRVRRPDGATGELGQISFAIGRPGISVRAVFANPPK